MLGNVGKLLLVLRLALCLLSEEVVNLARKFLLSLLELCVVILVVFEFVHTVDDLLRHQKVLILAEERKLQGLEFGDVALLGQVVGFYELPVC